MSSTSSSPAVPSRHGMARRLIPDGMQGRLRAGHARHQPGRKNADRIDGTSASLSTPARSSTRTASTPAIEILVNKPMFDYILINTLYSKAGQNAFSGHVTFPCGVLGRRRGRHHGQVLVEGHRCRRRRAASTPSRYWSIRRPRTARSTQPRAKSNLWGWSGCTSLTRRNSGSQWLWSTFEHVDNAPSDADVSSGNLKAKYNYYDPKCTAANCPPNEVPPRPWDPTRVSTFRSQVVRMNMFKRNRQRVRLHQCGGPQCRCPEATRRRQSQLGVAELRVGQHHVAGYHRQVPGRSAISPRQSHAGFPRQHNARNVHPGNGAARLIDLHRLPQRRQDHQFGSSDFTYVLARAN